MEITYDQQHTIIKNCHNLLTMGAAITHICADDVPDEEILLGWRLILWDIEKEIHEIVDPESILENETKNKKV